MNLAQMERIARRVGRDVPVRWWNHRRINRRWGRGMITNWDISRDLNLIAGVDNQEPWKPWMDRIQASGVPTNISGGLAGLIANPVTVNQATITGSATEQALIPTALLPIEQNVQSGKLYHLFVSGTSTTAATPGTYTLASRIGSAGQAVITSPLFGAVSSAFTPLASMTAAPWCIKGYVVIRGPGSTANIAAACFDWAQVSVASAAAGGPTSVSSAGLIGGVSASFDGTAAAGSSIWLGVTHATSTTNTWIPQLVAWASWN